MAVTLDNFFIGDPVASSICTGSPARSTSRRLHGTIPRLQIFWTHGLIIAAVSQTAKIADLIVAAEGLMRMDRYELIDCLRCFLELA
jgi:hypothetical protein